MVQEGDGHLPRREARPLRDRPAVNCPSGTGRGGLRSDDHQSGHDAMLLTQVRWLTSASQRQPATSVAKNVQSPSRVDSESYDQSLEIFLVNQRERPSASATQ